MQVLKQSGRPGSTFKGGLGMLAGRRLIRPEWPWLLLNARLEDDVAGGAVEEDPFER